MAESAENPLSDELEEANQAVVEAEADLNSSKQTLERRATVAKALKADISNLDATYKAYEKARPDLLETEEDLNRYFERQGRCLGELLHADSITEIEEIHKNLSKELTVIAEILGITESEQLDALIEEVRRVTLQEIAVPATDQAETSITDDYKQAALAQYTSTQRDAQRAATYAYAKAVRIYEHYKQLAVRTQAAHKRLDELRKQMSVAENENHPGLSYYILHFLYSNPGDQNRPTDVISLKKLIDKTEETWNAQNQAKAAQNQASDTLTARENKFETKWGELLTQITVDAKAKVELLHAIKPRDPQSGPKDPDETTKQGECHA